MLFRRTPLHKNEEIFIFEANFLISTRLGRVSEYPRSRVRLDSVYTLEIGMPPKKEADNLKAQRRAKSVTIFNKLIHQENIPERAHETTDNEEPAESL